MQTPPGDLESNEIQYRFAAQRSPTAVEILDVLPGSHDRLRLVIAVEKTLCGLEQLILRRETYEPQVGWFCQSQIAVEPDQLASLKLLLSTQRVQQAVKPKGSAYSPLSGLSGSEEPVIYRFPVAS